MTEAPEIVGEETFQFPKRIALVRDKTTAYSLGLVGQLRDTRMVPVRVGPGHLDQTVVYEYMVKTKRHAAVFLRSAWLRPVGSRDDGIRPLTIEVLVEGVVTLREKIDDHLRVGKYPFARRACACNKWEATLECKCATTPLAPSLGLMGAVDLAIQDGRDHAWPERPYGVFAPTDTLVQIRVVKPGSGPVDFQARCGITAALYSTSTKDLPQ